MFLSLKSVQLVVLSSAVMACLVWFFYLPNEQEALVSEPVSQHINAPEHKPVSEPAKVAQPSNLPGVAKSEKGFEFDESMKQELQRISDAYEEQIKYPEFSKPIDPQDLDVKYRANIPVANELPANLSDPNSPVLSVKTNQLRYFYGDEMTALASINGLPEEEFSSISARLLNDDKVVAYATVTMLNEAEHRYLLDFDTLQFDDVDWKRELTVDTEFSLSGVVYQRSTSVEYMRSIASVDHVAPSDVQEDYLQIPVDISTQKPGYHRVRANLYDAASNQPLVHLRAEGQVDSTSATLTLKAHISALKDRGSEGPYLLKDISLQRLPSKPDYITEFGHVENAVYAVEGHSFSEYLDRPYVNENSQRIAKELRRLGS